MATRKKITKAEAKRIAESLGIRFGGDYHADVSSGKADELAALAKLAGYRKPPSANGSTARYFYNHLSRLKGLSGLASRRRKRARKAPKKRATRRRR